MNQIVLGHATQHRRCPIGVVDQAVTVGHQIAIGSQFKQGGIALTLQFQGLVSRNQRLILLLYFLIGGL